jgi:drug/metabolite transporter (DMT)-like permease
MTVTAAPVRTALDRRGLMHLFIVYLVWGSTYLGIRVAVREGSGFPPFAMAFMRVVVAAAFLLGMARVRGERVRLRGREWSLLAISGLLLWVGGNGLVSWAEMRAASGLAALMVAAMPIWAALIEMVLDRKPPRWKAAASIAIGFAGVGVLSWPVLRQGSTGDIISVLGLLLAPLFWAYGSIMLQRQKPDLGVSALAGWQQVFGGAGLLVVAVARGEPMPAPTGEAWLAWGYLVVFGSVIAMTSYMATLKRLPYRIVSTYAYANPVIAVFLGWLILREPVTAYTLGGAALVVAGIAGVFHNRG